MRKDLTILVCVLYIFIIIVCAWVARIQIDEPVEVTEPEPISYIEEVESEPIEAEIEVEAEPEHWWTDVELDMLAAIIYHEAGSYDCSDRHQQLVGQVVMNRMASDEFPNTIYEVLTQGNPQQYITRDEVLELINTPDLIPQRCYDNALVVLNGEVECPDNVVWQANFKQGSGIYEEHYTSYSVSYFCYR